MGPDGSRAQPRLKIVGVHLSCPYKLPTIPTTTVKGIERHYYGLLNTEAGSLSLRQIFYKVPNIPS